MLLPTILCVAPVGHWGSGKNNPVTPNEIAEQTEACFKAGATMVHLHVRDKDGVQTADLEVFRETVAKIRQRCPILIQASTGGLSRLSAEQRSVAIEVEGIDVATLNLGSCNFFEDVYINTYSDIQYWAGRMLERGIVPEMCVFETGMLGTVARLQSKGLLHPRAYYNFSLGFPGAMPGGLENLLHLKRLLPTGTPWFGVEHDMHDFRAVGQSIVAGGHVRVGFEDSQHLDASTLATHNAPLVEKAASLATLLGRPPASLAQTRQLLLGR